SRQAQAGDRVLRIRLRPGNGDDTTIGDRRSAEHAALLALALLFGDLGGGQVVLANHPALRALLLGDRDGAALGDDAAAVFLGVHLRELGAEEEDLRGVVNPD